MNKISPKARHQARRFAVQALYQWEISQLAIEEIVLQFLTFDDIRRADQDYFKRLVLGTVESLESIDAQLQPHLDRKVSEVSLVELAILRLGAFELLYCPELPYRVALNEAIELGKVYGALDSYKYANGVLDKLAKQVRVLEVK